MKEIILSRGKIGLVSDEDYELVSQYKWSALHTKDGNWYAVCMMEGKYIYLHRWLLDAPKGQRIDHKDRNGLNNQRDNLRFCTPSQNNMNRISQVNKRIGIYKGVYRYGNLWNARVQLNYESISAGNYETQEEAGIAYNHLARKHFGEFALYNDIPGWESITPIPRKLNMSNTSGYIGVAWNKRNKKWEAAVGRNGVRIRLGLFKDAKEAALARDEAARRLYGEKAKLNF